MRHRAFVVHRCDEWGTDGFECVNKTICEEDGYFDPSNNQVAAVRTVDYETEEVVFQKLYLFTLSFY